MSFTSDFNISLDRDARCPAKTDRPCVILSFKGRAKHPVAVSDCLEVFLQGVLSRKSPNMVEVLCSPLVAALTSA